MKQLKDIKGVIVALVTPFDQDENVDLKRTENLVEFMISKKADALYVAGSTGEGFLMDIQERKVFLEKVIQVAKGRIPVIAHIGAISTKLSIDLALHAKSVGVDAISSVPPFYYRFNNEDIYNYYKDISDACNLPMVVYNIGLANLMSTELIYKLAEIKNVKGLKFTSKDHDHMANIKKHLGKDFMVYSGCDEMATSGFLANADGIIGSTYNILLDTFLEIKDLTAKNDYKKAFEIQSIATEFILYMVQWDFFAIMKQILSDFYIDAGFSRKPFKNPDKERMQDIYNFSKSLKKKYGKTHIDFIDKYLK